MPSNDALSLSLSLTLSQSLSLSLSLSPGLSLSLSLSLTLSRSLYHSLSLSLPPSLSLSLSLPVSFSFFLSLSLSLLSLLICLNNTFNDTFLCNFITRLLFIYLMCFDSSLNRWQRLRDESHQWTNKNIDEWVETGERELTIWLWVTQVLSRMEESYIIWDGKRELMNNFEEVSIWWSVPI